MNSQQEMRHKGRLGKNRTGFEKFSVRGDGLCVFFSPLFQQYFMRIEHY